MPSIAYSAEISPDPLLRRIVLGSGIVAGAVGVLVVLSLPLSLGMRLILSAGWALMSMHELRGLWRAWLNIRRFRFDSSGEIRVLDAAGQWRAASLVSGGVLLRKLGWIRLRDHSGQVFGELLSGDSRTSHDWRRLQVIWRHVGASG